MQTLRGDPVQPAAGSCRDSAWLLVQSCATSARRALRVRLPDPAQARRRRARRALGHRQGLHRPARLDRGLPARRRLDRPRPDLGPARGRRPHPARLRAAPERRRADHRHASDACEVEFAFAMRIDAHRRDAARHRPYTDDAVVGDRRARASGGRGARRGRRAADDGRRADLRRPSTTSTRRNGTPPRSAPQARARGAR